MTDLHAKIRQLEVDLTAQGLKVFPNTRVGQRAHSLWLKIRTQLVRGGAVQITPSALGLSWHRQQMKRARNVLVEMGLIRPKLDGRYVLGRYDRLDEEVRDQFLELKVLEGVLVALAVLMPKSKTQKGKERSQASQPSPRSVRL